MPQNYEEKVNQKSTAFRESMAKQNDRNGTDTKKTQMHTITAHTHTHIWNGKEGHKSQCVKGKSIS